MIITKYCKNPRKFRIILLLMIVTLIVITLLILNNGLQHVNSERLIDERFVAQAYAGPPQLKPQQLEDNGLVILKSPRENGVIQPEKYDEHKLKSRLIEEKIHNLKEQTKQLVQDPEEEHTVMESVSTAIHIFYTAPVQWYKTRKPTVPKEILTDFNTTENVTQKPAAKILNSAFYPSLGLYKPTCELFERHFQNIRNCGVGVLILSYTGKPTELEVYKTIFQVAPKFNLSITFEISVAGNQSLSFLQQHLKDIRKFYHSPVFFKVFSQSRKALTPVIYISNAYKLIDSLASQAFCKSSTSIRFILDAFFIGHIRLKNHADYIRRLCLDGFYSKLPSNGATFASTWKNWSYLKSFALTYKMLFVPTVGPGFAERNKFPRHGDIQRHRSNGRYYGVAWRTAILNHVGFINIASYNNWPDGSQIEEVIPKAGFLDYNPGAKTKYLDLTTHWVGNFIKTRNEAAAATLQSGSGHLSCYEYLNNTIC
ncbi:glycoprotein endo-alpha-1,2-mannosidase isoform X1 [Lucilia sericata]|uniref:glycoprotein endo-alpha-1,2-mannosidase isoform X1 n=1 Tax=Lucilia sericata TaxID=13632 RepID=UPI0018A868B3|nr:glycoprotein endo-alpha-1,2-mannosidase isoform X1 [Lucilia sericata]